MTARMPRVLTIAGMDSGGAAGVAADLKAFARCGAHGLAAVVALTAQNTVEVRAIHEVPPDFVRAQIEAVLDDIGADAAKTDAVLRRAHRGRRRHAGAARPAAGGGSGHAGQFR